MPKGTQVGAAGLDLNPGMDWGREDSFLRMLAAEA